MRSLGLLAGSRRMIAFYRQKRQYNRVAGNPGSPKDETLPFYMPQDRIAMKQRRISATYMRGGTSKGVFFRRSDLPHTPFERDRVLLRAIGSPDPYRQHMDGMGGATSSTSKVVVVWPSSEPGCDVDYDFGRAEGGQAR